MTRTLRFGEPEPGLDKSFEEVMLSGQALFNRKPSVYGRFGKVFKKQENVVIPRDQILLFTEDEDYENPIYLKTGDPDKGEFKSFAALVVAQKGSGKSGMVKTWMDQLWMKGIKFMCLEQKGFDFVTMNLPQEDPKGIECLGKFGMKPRSYSVAQAIPAFVADDYTKATRYKLDVNDFTSLPKTVQLSTWCKFLDIKEMSPPGKALMRVLKMGTKDRGPRDIREMVEFTKLDIERERAKRKEIKGSSQIVSTGLLYMLEQKLGTDELGPKMPFNFVEKLAENDIVVMHTPFDSKNLISMNVYISIAINSIINDRNIYVKTNGKQGLMSRPICFVIEEADTLIGGEDRNLAKYVLYQILARFRHIGCSAIFITQNAALIDRMFVRQCNYIASTQVNTEEQRQLLRMRGVPRWLIENKLTRLDWTTSKHVKEWFFLEPDKPGEVKTGYPIWPTNKLLKEGEGLADLV